MLKTPYFFLSFFSCFPSCFASISSSSTLRPCPLLALCRWNLKDTLSSSHKKTQESIESPISPVFWKKKRKNLWRKNKKLAIPQLERERFKCKWELRVTLESEWDSFRACQSLSHHTWLTRIQGSSWLPRNACEKWGERAEKGERWTRHLTRLSNPSKG